MTSRSEQAQLKCAIAVVGMVGRFPGAPDVESLWTNVLTGREGVQFFRADELDASIPTAAKNDPHYVRAKGLLPDCDRFDAGFFGITPLEAQLMDPQHRVLLELAWAALETSGHPPAGGDGRIGVYLGANWNRYRAKNVVTHPDLIDNFGELATALANEQDFLATRISYKLDLRGPSCTVSTACSTSLVAIAQAARALADGECDVALAGGASISVPVKAGYQYEPDGMLSRDGHCRPFDAEGSGTTFNDGAGIVVLRRLEDAIAAGDHIHAVIRGFAVNNDGADKVSFTAPSVAGQAAVLTAALAHAGVAPESIGYVETHGTATPMGDPIEFAALVRAYRGRDTSLRACAIGSVKSSVGHLVHAAGVTGFIMAVLAVEKGVIPPTLFFRTPNPRLQIHSSRFFVPTSPRQWNEPDHARRAGVSSFGVGGTNVHMVVEQPPAFVRTSKQLTAGPELLCVSARSQAALDRQMQILAAALPTADGTLHEVSASLLRRRLPMRCRAVVAVDSLAEGAAAFASGRGVRQGDAERPRRVTFVFPGHGCQRPGMAQWLHASSPVFRLALEDGARRVCEVGGPDPLPWLLDVGADAKADLRLTLPALFVFEHALASTLLANGLGAEMLIGCSLGEFSAAVLAGVMSLNDASRVVVRVAEAGMQAPVGGMFTAYCSAVEVREAAPEAAVAAMHAQDITVVAGSLEVIESVRRRLHARGIRMLGVTCDRAFHTSAVDEVVKIVEQALIDVPLSPPSLPILSATTGCELSDAEATSPAFWGRVLREPIRFAAALDQLGEGREHLLVEVGPGSGMTALALNHPQGRAAMPMAALPSSGLDESSYRELLSALGHCWANGADVDIGRSWQDRVVRPVRLPTYAFERARHWLEPAVGTIVAPRAIGSDVPAAAGPSAGAHPDTATRVANVLTGACGLEIDPNSTQQWAELGFDSLVITQLAISIRREFAVELGFRDLMEHHDSPQVLLKWLLARQVVVPATTAVVTNGTASTAPGSSPVAVVDSEPPKEGVRRPNPGARIERSVSEQFRLDDAQRAYVDDLLAAYARRTVSSKEYAQRHRRRMADPRTVSGFHPLLKEIVYPIVTDRSSGSRLWDLDGNEYIDFLNGFGCIFFGHSPQFLTDAVMEQLAKGIEVGPQAALAGEVAELFCRITGNERVAFSNTGSEAVAGALRVARTVTGRDKIVMFEGAYHGIFDEVVVRAGPRGMAMPGSPGIPRSHVSDVVVLPYGVDSSLHDIERLGPELAAVLVEPVQSRRPDLQPVEFLRRLRELTKASGTALILDEVVTGFRTHPGGIQALFGIRADLAIYGKVVAGGHPIGLIGGTAQFLDALDGGFWQFGDASVPEVGVTFFAGTFVRHPVALASTRAVLRRLLDAGPSLQADLGKRAGAMVGEIQSHLAMLGAKIKIASFQSMMFVSAAPSEVWSSLLFAQLRMRGIHIWEHFPCFLTTGHSDEDLARFKTTFCAVVTELVGKGLLTGRLPDANSITLQDPPVPGARLGRRRDGTLAWFVSDPDRPGGYRELVPGEVRS